MRKYLLLISFLFSGIVVLFLFFFFRFSDKNFYLGEISSPFWNFEKFRKEILDELDKVHYEIQDLQESISILKENLQNRREEEGLEEKVLLSSRVFQSDEENEKEKNELSKETLVICQKKNNDFPRHQVIFNEICWMGDEDSPANEWIEIKNVSEQEIDLSGWQILNKTQKIKIIFEDDTKIAPNEILVLKRGDDFSGAIKNSDEALFLFDKDCNLEDEIVVDNSWPAGDNFSKRTAERRKDLNWQTSQDPGGTPGKENSLGLVLIQEEESKKKESQISLSFPKTVLVNQEFDVLLSATSLENEVYDVKISILKISDDPEQKRTISEISLNGEEWQNSYNYLIKVFAGDSFSGNFKLRISQKYQDLRGEAEILAKIRQSNNKKVVFESKEKIFLEQPERISYTPFSVSHSQTSSQTLSSTSSLSENTTSSQEVIPLFQSIKILISEVCVGLDEAKNEFIELYNPNDFSILISDEYFKLKLVDSSNKVTTKKLEWKNNIIFPKKHFLLVGGEIPIEADATFSSQLTYVSGVIITDKNDNIIDRVAWGTKEKLPPPAATEGEGILLEEGLKTGQSLERIDFQDTDDNSKDFQLKLTPSPQNSKS